MFCSFELSSKIWRRKEQQSQGKISTSYVLMPVPTFTSMPTTTNCTTNCIIHSYYIIYSVKSCVCPTVQVSGRVDSLVPRPHPQEKKRVWWLLSVFLVVLTRQSYLWDTGIRLPRPWNITWCYVIDRNAAPRVLRAGSGHETTQSRRRGGGSSQQKGAWKLLPRQPSSRRGFSNWRSPLSGPPVHLLQCSSRHRWRYVACVRNFSREKVWQMWSAI